MEEQQKPSEKLKFIWVKPKEATAEIYSNYIHISWTLFDVRLQLGKLVPAGAELDEGFIVEQQGAVTLAWPEAKVLRDMLTDAVERYENTNGELKPLKLPPNTR